MRKQIIFLISALWLPCGVFSSLSMTVNPGKEECMVISIPHNEGAHISGSYDMLNDDLTATPLSVVLFDEKHNIVYRNRVGIPEGHFSIKDAQGRYRICIGNGFNLYIPENELTRSDNENERYELYKDHHHDNDENHDISNRDGKARTVGFSIRVEPTADALYKGQMGAEEMNSPIYRQLKDVTDASIELSDQLNNLLEHQLYMKDRDNVHEEYLEETLAMLSRWSTLEALTLVSVAFGQIMYFRRFFENRRYF